MRVSSRQRFTKTVHLFRGDRLTQTLLREFLQGASVINGLLLLSVVRLSATNVVGNFMGNSRKKTLRIAYGS